MDYILSNDKEKIIVEGPVNKDATVVKQNDLRANLKKYFDLVCAEGPVLVPRKENENVVIVSEKDYRSMQDKIRLTAYAEAFKKISEENQ